MKQPIRFLNKYAVYLTLFGAISACGSDSDNDEPIDITAPNILQVTPANEALDVQFSDDIQIIFDEDMLDTSFDEGAFELTSQGLDVLFDLSFDGQTRAATIQPIAEFGPSRSYQASLKNSVTDLSGNPLSTEVNWSFTTKEGEWQLPLLLSNPEGIYISYLHQLAENPQGQKAAVWGIYAPATETEEQVREINASIYMPSTGWAEVTTLNGPADSVSDPKIISLANNQFLTVWDQEDNGQYNLYSSHFTMDNGWSEAVLITQFDNGNSYEQNLYLDQEGKASVIWVLDEGSHQPHHIYSSAFDIQESSWSSPQVIEEHTDNISGLKFAQDDSGNILLAWYQIDDGAWGNRSKRYDATSNAGWLNSQSLDGSMQPRLVMNKHGQAIVGWYEDYDQGAQHSVIRVQHYNLADDSWSAKQSVSSENENTNATGSPYLAISDNGLIVVAWSQELDEEKRDIWSRSYQNGAWNTAVLIDNSGEGDSYLKDLVVDDLGNAMASWYMPVDGGKTNVFAARLNADGWQIPVALNDTTQQDIGAGQPYLHVNDYGRISAMWRDGGQTWFTEFK